MEVTKQTARRNHASLGQESATVSDVSTSIQSTETVDFAGRPSPKPLALGVQCEARGWLKWRTESGLKRQNEVRHNRVRKERAHKHTHTHTLTAPAAPVRAAAGRPGPGIEDELEGFYGFSYFQSSCKDLSRL